MQTLLTELGDNGDNGPQGGRGQGQHVIIRDKVDVVTVMDSRVKVVI